MLTAMAEQTGGRFFRATDTAQLADAYRTIDALEPMPQRAPALRPRHELFRWPLGAAVLLFGFALLARSGRQRGERPA